ncbi:MAG: hypothetical protein Ct9H90mP30_2070 [Actinomycetota bacterium]|nr:MAG: hypothetical protein Ct9H90mP30_2070 [Actinomycetota bacterium]
MYLMVFTIGAPLGSIIQGPLADKFGPQAVVLVRGFLFFGFAALILRISGKSETYNF